MLKSEHSHTTVNSSTQQFAGVRITLRRYAGWPKNLAHFSYALFSNFFHCQNQEKIYINTKDPTTSQMCRHTTLWNVNVLKQKMKTRLLW